MWTTGRLDDAERLGASRLPVVGIVGAYGAVGRTVSRLLAQWGKCRLRLGGRNPDAVRRALGNAIGTAADVLAVDLLDDTSLERFCRGCGVVVQCAGPSYVYLDRVARAAFAAGADSVDPGGDLPVHARLADVDFRGNRRTALLTAGMMPGLSGLLMRWLAQAQCGSARRLIGYVGGRGHLTEAGAADYLLSLVDTTHDTLTAWRGGTRLCRALAPLKDADLPFFPKGVTAVPFLSAEAERVARSLALDDVSWYTVYEGEQMLATLRRMPKSFTDTSALMTAAAELSRAADLDLCGRTPYQQFVLRIDGDLSAGPVGRTLVLRAADAQALTGAVTALAVDALLEGALPPGLHFAADVLSCETVDRLRQTSAVTLMDLIDEAAGAPREMDEGIL
jgi:hypothetical protein